MNYWHDDDQDIWYDSISSYENMDNINDHLDKEDSKKKPTKDISDSNPKDEGTREEIWYDTKHKHKPFHLTIDHQTIGHKEKGRQHQVMFTSHTVVDVMLSNLDWKELVGHHEPFDTTCFVISTIQKFQRLTCNLHWYGNCWK